MFKSFTPVGAHFYCKAIVRSRLLTPMRTALARAIALSLAGLAALALTGLVRPVWAQASAPSSAASSTPSQDRSQDPAYSVFRWIKIQGDAPRKTDAPKPKPKQEAAAPVVARKPDTQGATTTSNGITERVETIPAANVPAKAATSAELAPLTAAAASAPAPAVTVAAAVPAAAKPPEPVEEVETELKLISQAQPSFPRELRREISKGKVMVKFTVQPDGSVSDASVVSFSNRGLNRPALEAISQWKFEPIQTARTVQVEIEFEL